MTDDTSKRGNADRLRININQAYEVRHWTKAMGVTKRALIEAVMELRKTRNAPTVLNVKIYFIKRIKSAK